MEPGSTPYRVEPDSAPNRAVEKGSWAKTHKKHICACVCCTVLLIAIALVVALMLTLYHKIAPPDPYPGTSTDFFFRISGASLNASFASADKAQELCPNMTLRLQIEIDGLKTDSIQCHMDYSGSAFCDCSILWADPNNNSYPSVTVERGMAAHFPNVDVFLFNDGGLSPVQNSFVMYTPDYLLENWTQVAFQILDPVNQVNYSISFSALFDTQFFPPNSTSTFYRRANVSATAYADGESYYSDLHAALASATTSIYITDWWFSPQIYLLRPVNATLDLSTRLDILLAARAAQGVKVRILLYDNEVLPQIDISAAVPEIRATDVRDYMQSLHPNIKVIPHQPSTNARLQILPLALWSHHQKTVVVDGAIAFVGGIDLCFGRFDTHSHTLRDDGGDPYAGKVRWPGIDYYNREAQPPLATQLFYEELFNRSLVGRVPWHDIHMSVVGDIASDVGSNFVQRWNFHRVQLELEALYPVVDQSADTNLNNPLAKAWLANNPGTQTCQVLRSVSPWSAGISREQSIYSKMVYLIKNAERFIYIENQFFISGLGSWGEDKPERFRNIIENQIAAAILERVEHAIRTGTNFRVLIIVPSHPEGDIDAISVQGVWNVQQQTIARGQNALLNILRARYPATDLTQYITFFSLRNYAHLAGAVVTEHIYVHAKLLIVDDRSSVIGSANINDRSLLGDRDSEISIFCQDDPDVNPEGSTSITLNGQPYRVSTFVHNLRMSLINEHMGLDPNSTWGTDILDESVWNSLLQNASTNTDIYTKVFPNIPRDEYTVLDDWHAASKLPINSDLVYLLDSVQGQLVQFPSKFLSNEANLWPVGGSCPPGPLLSYCYELVT